MDNTHITLVFLYAILLALKMALAVLAAYAKAKNKASKARKSGKN